MWRPAISRCGAVACLACVACWTGGNAPTPVSAPQLERGARDVSGPYWCSIDNNNDEAERELYPCAIKQVGSHLMLAKLAGDQRLRGTITLEDDGGFTFVGEAYCVDDDCNQPLHGRFKPVGRGRFTGSFREDDSMILHLRPAPANAFAGASYGGARYGDPFAYDGSRYGGRGYGQLDIHHPRKR